MIKIAELSAQHTKGAICGSGLGNDLIVRIAKFLKLTDFINSIHGTSQHDGVVALNSCQAVNEDAPWSTDLNSDFLIVPYNHNDTIARSGNHQDVIEWLEKRD